MQKEPIIQFDAVSKGYAGQTAPVLDTLNLSVMPGEFITMIGKSGCGKTTLLKLVNGLLTPDTGTIYVEGQEIRQMDQVALRRKIGYAIQGTGLFPHMNVWKNIAYVPNLLNRRNREKTRLAVEKWMGIVGLAPELAKRYPCELSGGQKQRVGIARALAASPRILLMDEPFGAVDEITRRMLQKEIRRIHQTQGVTVLFVTHDIREAFKLGSRVLVMSDGRIVQSGTPEEIKASPADAFVRELVSDALE